VRLPFPFAERLYATTELGLRVVIVRDDIAPVAFSHPVLFKSAARHEPARAGPSSAREVPASGSGAAARVESLRARASALSAQAEAAGGRAREARQIAARKAADAQAAGRQVRGAETTLARAEKAQQDAETALARATDADKATKPGGPDRAAKAQLAKAKADEKLAEARAQLEAAEAQAQAKSDAAVHATEAAQAADEASDGAMAAAGEAERRLSPISVFVSRKAQRLYVRRANQPIYEAPIAIREPDKPIGSFVFTALGSDGGVSDVRWSVVSMFAYGANGEPLLQGASAREAAPRRRNEAKAAEATFADVAAARLALDRIDMPPEVAARFAEVVLPGASLIVSDEAASIETGKDTDFVIIMSGEPQGALKARRREPVLRERDFFGGPSGPYGFPFRW
jgi:hypothetical protein